MRARAPSDHKPSIDDIMDDAFSNFFKWIYKHKWAILWAVLLTAAIVAPAIVFWPVIVGFAPVVTAAAAITALTLKVGFAVSATAFAATSISVLGAAFVAATSWILDAVIGKIQNRSTYKKDVIYKKHGLLDDPLLEDDLLDEDDTLGNSLPAPLESSVIEQQKVDILYQSSLAGLSKSMGADLKSAKKIDEEKKKDNDVIKEESNAEDEEFIDVFAKPMRRSFLGMGLGSSQ